MSSSTELTGLALSQFVELVAARNPTPGGGSVAATLGALGAGLASMAFGVAAGEGRSAVPAYMAGRAEELDRLRAALLACVDADAGAYAAWRVARDAGGESEGAAAARALEVPLETMEHALAGLRLVAAGTRNVPGGLASECLVAAVTLRAAVDAAGAIAADNAGAFEDASLRTERRATVDALRARAEELLTEVKSTTEARA